MSEPQPSQPLASTHSKLDGIADDNLTISDVNSAKSRQPAKVVVADLNIDPPEIEDEESKIAGPTATAPFPAASRVTIDESCEDRGGVLCKDNSDVAYGEVKRLTKLAKCRSRIGKVEENLECGVDVDVDQHSQGISSSREEKISSLKTGLALVARKIPKNAHAHFLLGLMYQRLGQPQKAVPAYEKATEILLGSGEEIDRPELLSLVQIHHAQCLLLESIGDGNMEKELEPEGLEEIISKLKESVQLDIGQASVWNTLGMIILKTGNFQDAISVFSSLLSVAPDNLDCVGNLGLAHLASGNLDAALKCFQKLILKDQGHPSALINYATAILCKYGSVVAGAGANAAEGAAADQIAAVNVAKECLLAALKADNKSAHIWANLANAYHILGDHRSSGKCLEKAAKLEPNCMSTRYAVAVHRIKQVERLQSPGEQLIWSGNEMASIIREGDPSVIKPPIAWAGLAMVQKAQHEIVAAFDCKQNKLTEAEERASYSLKQVIGENPDDAVQWHQLGLHSLYCQQFNMSQKYFKAAIARFKECSFAWSNLGISLQLAEEPTQSEEVFKQALSLPMSQQVHTLFSNLGNLYRQQKQYDRAKAMFTNSLKLHPGYAPAYNNLGLVLVAEGLYDDAKFCFEKALHADPLLDAAKSNMVKVVNLCRTCTILPSALHQD